jgi:hypothetical protein
MTFQEVTLIEDGTQNEIMFNVDLDTGKVTRAYTYADSIPEKWVESKNDFKPIRNYEMTNKVFRRLHLGDLKNIPLIAALDDDDSEFIQKSLGNYSPFIEFF